ncbi:hypothetical protein JCM10450v2_001601 [Rhodotorula kratochvilovae]
MTAPASAPTHTPTRRRRTRLPPPEPTNVLILVLPPVFWPILPLLHAHFANYGTLHAWTPLERFGRVVCVYNDAAEAHRGKDEMDGFVWEDEHERTEQHPQPLRVYYGPTFPLERLAYLPRTAAAPPTAGPTLLEVPSSGKNFLISPPGSPPVGWEQIEEDAPNQRTFHDGDELDDTEFEELKKAGGGDDERWADELTRALRFLSVEGGGDDDDEVEDGDEAMDDVEQDPYSTSTTQLVLPPAPLPSVGQLHGAPDSPAIFRPAVTVSSPPPSHEASSPTSATATPPPGASKISSVKATIESMIRGDSNARITPTSRPPLA